jgi:hypothetical protein
MPSRQTPDPTITLLIVAPAAPGHHQAPAVFGRGRRTAMSDERWAEVHAAKDKHCAALLAKPGVNYVGVSLKQTAGRQTDTPTIVVAVRSKLPLAELADDAAIPATIDGVATDVIEDALHVKKIAGSNRKRKHESSTTQEAAQAARQAQAPAQAQAQAQAQVALAARPRAFTCLWASHEADLFAESGLQAAPRALHLAGQGNAKQRAHHKLDVGDLYYPLRLHQGALSVVGCLEVTRRIDVRADGMDNDAVSAWLRERQLKPAASSCYVPAVLYETRSDRPWINRVGADAATVSNPGTLRWLRPDGQERSGRANVASLNSVFRLSRQSARVLDDILVAAQVGQN